MVKQKQPTPSTKKTAKAMTWMGNADEMCFAGDSSVQRERARENKQQQQRVRIRIMFVSLP